MPFIGVRISWLMFARKADLRRALSSALFFRCDQKLFFFKPVFYIYKCLGIYLKKLLFIIIKDVLLFNTIKANKTQVIIFMNQRNIQHADYILNFKKFT